MTTPNPLIRTCLFCDTKIHMYPLHRKYCNNACKQRKYRIIKYLSSIGIMILPENERAIFHMLRQNNFSNIRTDVLDYLAAHPFPKVSQ